MSCGVPQGSVIGPDLWNVLYDDLLRMELPTDVELIAFADDVPLVATASDSFLLEERLEVALQKVDAGQRPRAGCRQNRGNYADESK